MCPVTLAIGQKSGSNLFVLFDFFVSSIIGEQGLNLNIFVENVIKY